MQNLQSFPVSFSLFLLISSPYILQGQTRGGADFVAHKPYIKQVSLKKLSYAQELDVLGPDQCLCKFVQTEESKGKSKVYTFNLADIHPSSIMQATQKDAVFVEMNTLGKKKLIQTTENNKVTGYGGEITIFTEDLEDAKSLKEVLKHRANTCKDIMEEKYNRERFKTPSYALDFLKEEIQDFAINELQYAQQFSYDAKKPWMLSYKTTNEKGERVEFAWNASDINPSEINFLTKQENVLVNVSTKKGKNFIWHQEDGELQNFQDKFYLNAPDIESARIWVVALKAISTAFNEPADLSPKFETSTLSQVIATISPLIGEVNINEEGYDQSLYKAEGATSELRYQVEELGRTESNSFQWNLADIDPGKIEFDTYKREVRINIRTRDSENYIQEIEDNIPSGYTSKLSFIAKNIESARELVYLLRKGVNLAREAYRDPFTNAFANPSTQQALTFCQNNIQEVQTRKETYGQSIGTKKEDPCLISFESEEKSKGDLFTYTFHLEDVDPGNIQMKTRGDILFLELKSKGKKDWIEVAENGERDDFDDELVIRVQSLETAKGLKKALAFLTRSCQD